MYWKRAQAGRILRDYPQVEQMVRKGDLQISHVNIIAAKITPANAEVLLERVKGQSKRGVQYAVDTTTRSGEVIEREPQIELRLSFRKSELEKLERAIEILSSRGRQVSQVDALVAGLEDLLERRDPIRKADRAAKRTLSRNKLMERNKWGRKQRKDSPDPDQGRGQDRDISTSEENLTLRCRYHNQQLAKKMLGRDLLFCESVREKSMIKRRIGDAG